MKIKLKVWGPREAIKQFTDELEETYIGTFSNLIESDQGGVHAYATIRIEVGEKT